MASRTLDAMSFALYGDTSGGAESEGGRSGAAMRSDHADPGTLTRVVFDFSIGADLYRVERLPEQERPKLRGEGTTSHLQEATMWRLRRGGDGALTLDGTPLATGWTKVKAKAEDVLGFRGEQFRQVVMLPQGRFQQLIEADSNEREQILRALVRVGLDELLEAPLGEHDHLAELLAAEAEHVLSLGLDLRPAGGQGGAVDRPGAVVAATEAPHRGLLGMRGRALSAQLGTLLLGEALHAVEVGADREVKDDAGERAGVGVVAAHRGAAAAALALGAAAGVAVEGERHGVEDGRLARAGGSGDEEESGAAQVGEVERLHARVGPEGLHGDGQRPHPGASRRRRSSPSMMAARSARCSSLRRSPVA